MNLYDKRIHIIGLCVVILILIVIAVLMSYSSEETDSENNGINDISIPDTDEENDLMRPRGLWSPLTGEEIETIEALREGPLSQIEKTVPPDVGYSIKYEEDITGEPVFRIVINANTWKELSLLEQRAMEKFRALDVEPCDPPLINAITIRPEDWDKFDFDSPDPEKPLCP